MPDDAMRLPAEARARALIDQQLTAAGWAVQDRKDLNLFTGDGQAVRETVMAPGHGRADYLLYVDKKVVGAIEAKPEGTTLSGVEWQSAMYATGLPEFHRSRAVEVDGRLPFVFEASGTETHFTNGFDPEPRARLLRGGFPQPGTLARIVRAADDDPASPTWRARSVTSRRWTPPGCAMRRSTRSAAWNVRWPPSSTPARWCRWPPAPARPTPPSRSRTKLVADDSIVVADGVGHVMRDIVFSSPSTAGAIVTGRSCNGREAWISPGGSFGEWESRGVE